jgi:hypothetical protein
MKGDSEQEEITSDDRARIRSFIEKHNWISAKTMPQWPHEYTLRKNANEEEFLWFVFFIRERGYAESFGGQKHIYLDVDGWKYWTMGSPLDDTVLINRARTEKQRDIYDQQAWD